VAFVAVLTWFAAGLLSVPKPLPRTQRKRPCVVEGEGLPRLSLDPPTAGDDPGVMGDDDLAVPIQQR
jgi:hypothetical protein